MVWIWISTIAVLFGAEIDVANNQYAADYSLDAWAGVVGFASERQPHLSFPYDHPRWLIISQYAIGY
jgi:uncharacterized BrkB/YihY/UPF0761 family membrane protein